MCSEHNQGGRELETMPHEELLMKQRELVWRREAVGKARCWSSSFCHVEGIVWVPKGFSEDLQTYRLQLNTL